MIRAITFDLDGVYFPDGKSKFLEKLIHLGISDEDARKIFLKSIEMNQLYKNGKMSDRDYWIWAAEQWGIKMQPEELIQLLADSYSVSTEVLKVVKKAREKGYRTLICSNNFPSRVNSLQKKFGFLNDFDATVFSYEVGASKPDEKIFKALIEKSGVEPEEIVFADDNVVNLSGAKNLGITTFLFEDFDQFIRELNKLGVTL